MPLNWNLINDQDSSVEGCDYQKYLSIQRTSNSKKSNILNSSPKKISQSLSQKHKQKLKIKNVTSLKQGESYDIKDQAADNSPKVVKKKVKYQQKSLHSNKNNQKQTMTPQKKKKFKEIAELNISKEEELNNQFNPINQQQLTLLNQDKSQSHQNDEENKILKIKQETGKQSFFGEERLQVENIQVQVRTGDQQQSQYLEKNVIQNQQKSLQNSQELFQGQQRALSDSDFEQELERMRKSLKNKNKKMKRKKQAKEVQRIDLNNPFSLLQKV